MSVVERRQPDAVAIPTLSPPEAPAPGEGERRFGMIEPPGRGDGPAARYLWMGIGFYAVFFILFVASLLGSRADKREALLELFGIGQHANLITTILILAGIGLTGLATYTVGRDIRHLRKEENDVDWVLEHRRDGLMLVFVPHEERAARLARREMSLRDNEARHVETLVDDRVRRVHQAQLDGGASHISADELRGIAETRTLRYGHVARFASSLLLLLAVLGTFAGVKTALPSLIDAISATEGAGASGAQGGLVGPLRAVSDAFGGNSLALVGAIAVGLMAQGLSVGRRHLLERLELASAEYIYDRRRAQSADPLIAAVDTLSGAAEAVRDASGSFLGLEGSLEGLAESFRTGFDTLNDQLSDLMRNQDEALHQRTSQSLQELQERVLALSGAIEHNTRLYGGLVERVGERSAESREAMKAMQGTSQMLGVAIASIQRLGTQSDEAATRLQSSLDLLATGTGRVDERMAAVADSIERARPAMQEVEATVRAAADRVADIDARAAQSWREAGEEVRKQFASMRADHAPAAVAAGGGLSPDAVGLLRRIAAAAEAPRGPSPTLIAGGAMAGVLGAAGVLYVVTHLRAWLALVGL